MAVYILEFSEAIGNAENPHGTARTYVGWTLDNMVAERIYAHQTGRGAHITQAAAAKNIQMQMAAVFPGGKKLERKIKNYKNAPKLLANLRRGIRPDWLPMPIYLR